MFKLVKTTNEIKIVERLANIIWREAYKNLLSIDQIEYMLKEFQSETTIKEQIKDNHQYYLIYNNDEEIGFFSYVITDHIYLSKIYILKEYRKQGYAKKVIKFLKEKRLNIKLRVNKENIIAVNSYKRLGFIITGKLKTDIGGGFYMDDYLMESNYSFDDLLKEEQEKEYFKTLLKSIENESKNNIIYPPKDSWFKALELTPFESVKVVLIGQDPYFNENQAMGLAFSVSKDVKIPASLMNIYKEIANEYGKPMPNHGDLTGWAKQGVLLLNSVLTVSAGNPLSHQDFGWQKFTDEVINLLQNKDFIVYILLGNHAHKYEKKITNKNHVILKTTHPSPLSSYRGFLGSNIFKKTNECLKENNIDTINWYLL